MTDGRSAEAQSLAALVAEEIRVAMTRRRFTGAKLAKALGVSETWVSYRLNGKVALDLNDLERIAKVLDCKIIELLPNGGGDVNRPKDRPTERPTDTRPNGRAATTKTRRPRLVVNPFPAAAMTIIG